MKFHVSRSPPPGKEGEREREKRLTSCNSIGHDTQFAHSPPHDDHTGGEFELERGAGEHEANDIHGERQRTRPTSRVER